MNFLYREENHDYNHYNNKPHYHFTFSRYGQIENTDPINDTKSKKSKSSKRHTNKHYL